MERLCSERNQEQRAGLVAGASFVPTENRRLRGTGKIYFGNIATEAIVDFARPRTLTPEDKISSFTSLSGFQRSAKLLMQF